MSKRVPERAEVGPHAGPARAVARVAMLAGVAVVVAAGVTAPTGPGEDGFVVETAPAPRQLDAEPIPSSASPAVGTEPVADGALAGEATASALVIASLDVVLDDAVVDVASLEQWWSEASSPSPSSGTTTSASGEDEVTAAGDGGDGLHPSAVDTVGDPLGAGPGDDGDRSAAAAPPVAPAPAPEAMAEHRSTAPPPSIAAAPPTAPPPPPTPSTTVAPPVAPPIATTAPAPTTTIAVPAPTTTTTTTTPPPTAALPPATPPGPGGASEPPVAGPTPTAEQWAQLRACESGDDYSVVSHNGRYFGAYQFSQPTWDWLATVQGRADLVGVAPNAAPPADQDAMALLLWQRSGPGQWPSCGAVLPERP